MSRSHPFMTSLAAMAICAGGALWLSAGNRSNRADAGTAMLGTTVVEAISGARHDLELGFTIRGRVAEVLVQPGHRVEKGQALIRLDDRETALQVELLKVRAASSLEADAAEAEWKLAIEEEKRVRDAESQQGAAAFEIERAALRTKLAQVQHQLALQKRQEAAIQLAAAEVQHELFTLKAPLGGIIEEVVVEPGEMVDEVKPVLRLVVIDPLWIDAPTPTDAAAGLKVGDKATVVLRTTGSAPREMQGTVVHIASVADPGSDTRLVRVEVANPEGLPAGTHAEVRFGGG